MQIISIKPVINNMIVITMKNIFLFFLTFTFKHLMINIGIKEKIKYTIVAIPIDITEFLNRIVIKISGTNRIKPKVNK